MYPKIRNPVKVSGFECPNSSLYTITITARMAIIKRTSGRIQRSVYAIWQHKFFFSRKKKYWKNFFYDLQLEWQLSNEQKWKSARKRLCYLTAKKIHEKKCIVKNIFFFYNLQQEWQLSIEQVAEYKEVFMLFDKDEDGVLSFPELTVVMKSLGQRPSGKHKQNIFYVCILFSQKEKKSIVKTFLWFTISKVAKWRQ